MEGQIGRGRLFTRFFLTLLYLAAGWFHLTTPEPFLTIIPNAIPFPDEIVFLTGVAEIAGAIGLWIPKLRKATGIGLALYALCVWPANVNHMFLDLGWMGYEARPDGLPLAYHVPRQFLQPVLIWVALWAGHVIDWPWRSERQARRA